MSAFKPKIHELGPSAASASQGGVGTVAIITAASNVNGILIKAASIHNSGGEGSILANALAPASSVDGRVIAHTGNGMAQSLTPMPIFIPAGLGVWLRNSTGASTAAGNITYELF